MLRSVPENPQVAGCAAVGIDPPHQVVEELVETARTHGIPHPLERSRQNIAAKSAVPQTIFGPQGDTMTNIHSH